MVSEDNDEARHAIVAKEEEEAGYALGLANHLYSIPSTSAQTSNP